VSPLSTVPPTSCRSWRWRRAARGKPAATADLTALFTAETQSQGLVLTNASGSPVFRVGDQDPWTACHRVGRQQRARRLLVVAAPSSLTAPAADVAVRSVRGWSCRRLPDRAIQLGETLASLQSLAAAQGMRLLVLDEPAAW